MTTYKQKGNIESINGELTGVASGAAINIAGKAFGGIFVYIYSIVVARQLGVKSYGVFILGVTIINFAGVISRLGLDTGIVKYVACYRGENDSGRIKGTLYSALRYACGASLLMIVLVWLLAEPILTQWFNKPELVHIVRALSLSLPFGAIMIVDMGFTQGLKIMKYWVYTHNLALPISNLIFTLIFLGLGYQIFGVVVAHITSVMIAAVVSLFFIERSFPALKRTEAISESKKLLRVSIPLSITLILNYLLMWTDTMMLGYFGTIGEVGIYSSAVKTALLINLVLVSFNCIFAPVISDLHNKKEIQQLEKLLKVITRWVFTISLALFLCIAIKSKEILRLFGPDFADGSHCLILLAFSQLINGGTGPVGLILAMTGSQNLLMYSTIIACLLNIVLNFLLIPVYGIFGAAVASWATMLVLNIIMLVAVNFLLGIHPYDVKSIKVLITGLATIGLSLYAVLMFPVFFKQLNAFVAIFLVLLVYLGILMCWGVEEEDRLLYKSIKQRFLKIQ